MRQEVSLYLDLVRFSAAMTVFIGHASGRAFTGGILWQFGLYLQTAVIVFFVLSGFVIGYVADTKEKTLSDYWSARIARLGSIVVPALALTLVCDAVGLGLNRDFYVHGPWRYPEEAQPLRYLLSLFLVGNVWDLDLTPGINKPFWSLSYELMYYALFSAAFFLRGARRTVTMLALAALAGPSILGLFPIWLMGYGCYHAMARYGDRLQRQPLLFGTLSLALLLLLLAGSPWVRDHALFKLSFIGRERLLGDYFDGLVFSLHLLFSLPVLLALKRWLVRFAKPIQWLGSLTFALYLFHRPLIQILAVLSPEPPTAWSSRLLVLGGTLLVVATFGAWCEKQKFAIRRALRTVALPWIRRVFA